MDNNNTTAAYSTANLEEFRMEVISLLHKINDWIVTRSSKANASDSRTSKQTATSLGVLKTHEFKLKEVLTRLEDMKNEEWIEYKADLIRDFDAAHRDLQPGITK